MKNHGISVTRWKSVLWVALFVLTASAFAERAKINALPQDPNLETEVLLQTPGEGVPLPGLLEGLARAGGYTPILREVPERTVWLRGLKLPLRDAWDLLYRTYLRPDGYAYAVFPAYRVIFVAPERDVRAAVEDGRVPRGEAPTAPPAKKEAPKPPEAPAPKPEPAPPVVEVFDLRSAPAKETAEALSAQFPEGSFTAVGNKVVARYPRALEQAVRRVVSALDVPAPTAELVRRKITLKYALPSSVAGMLKTLLPPPEQGPALRVFPEDQAHTLLLYGPAPLVKEAEALARSLDVPKPQYRVHVNIETTDTSFLRSLGVEWNTLGGGLIGAVVNAADGLSLIFDSTKTLLPLNLQAAFAALEKQGLAENVHRSSLLVGAGETAKVTSGFTFFLRTEQNGKVVKTPYDAGLVIEATPVPTGDGSIELSLYVELSDILERNPVDGDIDKLSKRSTRTLLRLRPGDTVVLASVDRTKFDETSNKVPLLGDIPILGQLFKSTNTSRENSTLVVSLQVEAASR